MYYFANKLFHMKRFENIIQYFPGRFNNYEQKSCCFSMKKGEIKFKKLSAFVENLVDK